VFYINDLLDFVTACTHSYPLKMWITSENSDRLKQLVMHRVARHGLQNAWKSGAGIIGFVKCSATVGSIVFSQC
jgi:hypothetical protein